MGVHITRDNHYTPCLYLKRFTDKDGQLHAYRTLVPHEQMRTWKPTSPKAIGFLEHLYTRNVDGQDKDDIEKWLKRDFEDPVIAPLEKAIADVPLTARDWSHLIRFLAAQYVRTPGYYFQNLGRWNNKLTETLNATCHDVVNELHGRRSERFLPAPKRVTNGKASLDLSGFLVVGVEMIVQPDHETASLRLSTVVGRNTWVASMLSILQGEALELLQSYHWTILRPYEGYTWFATDHPVVVMMVTGENRISFSAGVGQIGTQIFLPLDPFHLMYTEVGGGVPPRGSRLGVEDTRAIRAVMARHAFRMVFSSYEDSEIPNLRPRVVDAKQFSFERIGWQKWHPAQIAAEVELRRRTHFWEASAGSG